MSKMILVLIFILMCNIFYANINLSVSSGIEIYKKSLGYSLIVEPQFSFPNFFVAPFFTMNYFSYDNLLILNYGCGLDIGYKFDVGSFNIIPACSVGYLWGNIQNNNIEVAKYNIFYSPHLELDYQFNEVFSFGVDVKYKICELKDSFFPSTSNVSVNLVFNFRLDSEQKIVTNEIKKVAVIEIVQETNLKTLLLVETNIVINIPKVITEIRNMVKKGKKKEAIDVVSEALKSRPDDVQLLEILQLLKSKNIETTFK